MPIHQKLLAEKEHTYVKNNICSMAHLHTWRQFDSVGHLNPTVCFFWKLWGNIALKCLLLMQRLILRVSLTHIPSNSKIPDKRTALSLRIALKNVTVYLATWQKCSQLFELNWFIVVDSGIKTCYPVTLLNKLYQWYNGKYQRRRMYVRNTVAQKYVIRVDNFFHELSLCDANY